MFPSLIRSEKKTVGSEGQKTDPSLAERLYGNQKTINLGDSENASPSFARMKKEMFVVPTIIDSSTQDSQSVASS